MEGYGYQGRTTEVGQRCMAAQHRQNHQPEASRAPPPPFPCLSSALDFLLPSSRRHCLTYWSGHCRTAPQISDHAAHHARPPSPLSLPKWTTFSRGALVYGIDEKDILTYPQGGGREVSCRIGERGWSANHQALASLNGHEPRLLFRCVLVPVAVPRTCGMNSNSVGRPCGKPSLPLSLPPNREAASPADRVPEPQFQGNPPTTRRDHDSWMTRLGFPTVPRPLHQFIYPLDLAGCTTSKLSCSNEPLSLSLSIGLSTSAVAACRREWRHTGLLVRGRSLPRTDTANRSPGYHPPFTPPDRPCTAQEGTVTRPPTRGLPWLTSRSLQATGTCRTGHTRP